MWFLRLRINMWLLYYYANEALRPIATYYYANYYVLLLLFQLLCTLIIMSIIMHPTNFVFANSNKKTIVKAIIFSYVGVDGFIKHCLHWKTRRVHFKRNKEHSCNSWACGMMSIIINFICKIAKKYNLMQ